MAENVASGIPYEIQGASRVALRKPELQFHDFESRRDYLIYQAAEAMREAGALAEMPVLRVLGEPELQDIIDYYRPGPRIFA
jgi:hypothetical protein